MKTQLIVAAMVAATAALSSPALAQNTAASGPESFGRSFAAPQIQRTGTFRRAFNHSETAFLSDGRLGAGAVDRSRPGSIDPDLRPAAN